MLGMQRSLKPFLFVHPRWGRREGQPKKVWQHRSLPLTPIDGRTYSNRMVQARCRCFLFFQVVLWFRMNGFGCLTYDKSVDVGLGLTP